MVREQISAPAESVSSFLAYPTPAGSEHGYDSDNSVFTPRTNYSPPPTARQRRHPARLTDGFGVPTDGRDYQQRDASAETPVASTTGRGDTDSGGRAATRWPWDKITLARVLVFAIVAGCCIIIFACGNKPKAIVEPSGADFPKLMNTQMRLSDVVENGVGGIAMSLELKRSEMEVRKFDTLVRISRLGCKYVSTIVEPYWLRELTVDRAHLSNRLESFADAAKDSSKGMSQFSHKVINVVHEIIDMDERVVRQLEHLQAERIAAEAYSDAYRRLVSPFVSLPHHDLAAAEQAISDTFVDSSEAIGISIQLILWEARLAVQKLDDMENKLLGIYEIFQSESASIDDEGRHKTIWQWLLNFLTDNGVQVTEDKKRLIKDLNGYHSRAADLVAKTLSQLQDIEVGLTHLRDRVAEPAVLAAAGYTIEQIPLDKQIRSIRSGMKEIRLSLGRARMRDKR